MSKIIEKGKTALKTATGSPITVVKQLAIGGAVGVLVDFFVTWIYTAFLAETVQGTLGDRLEVGFPFYMGHDVTSIAWDDVLLIILTLGMLLFGWFRKRFWFIIGFGLGWYGSSCLNLYGALLKPLLEWRPE